MNNDGAYCCLTYNFSDSSEEIFDLYQNTEKYIELLQPVMVKIIVVHSTNNL